MTTGEPRRQDDDRHDEGRSAGLGGRAIAAIIAAVAVTAVVVVWLMRNRDSVEIDWLFTTTDAPIWLVLLIAAVMGWIIGILLTAVVRHRIRRE